MFINVYLSSVLVISFVLNLPVNKAVILKLILKDLYKHGKSAINVKWVGHSVKYHFIQC